MSSKNKKKNKNSSKDTTNTNIKTDSNNSLNNQMMNELKSKYKIDELSVEHEEVQKKKIEENEYENKHKEILEAQKSNYVDTSDVDAIGWKKPKTLAKNFLFGIFMGLSDGVPGYSGGTTLSIIGFYDKLISNIRNFFSTKTNFFKVNIKYLLWFIPFLIGWIGAFIGLTFAIRSASDNNYGIVFVFLFGFFALFSIPIFYIKNKKDILSFKKLGSQMKQSKAKIISLSLMVFGLLLMVSFGLMARFIPTTGGVSFLRGDNNEKLLDPSNFDTNRILVWCVAGYLSGIAVMIPGVSGSIILYIFNIYPQLNYAIANVFNDANFIPYIVIILLFGILGIITSIFVINKITSKWNKQFMNFSMGLVSGSFITIFISLSAADYQTLTNTTILGLSIGMIFVALVINVIIFIALNEFKIIDYPKLRFINKKDNEQKSLN